MQIIILLLTITTIAGWSFAAFLIRRNMQTPQNTVQPSGTHHELDLADLGTHLAHETNLEGVFRAAGEWLCSAGKLSYVIFYVYDHASHELTNPVVVGRDMPTLPRRLRMVANAYGSTLNTRLPHLAEWPARSSNFGPTSQDVQSAYIVPLFDANTPLGVMCLQAVRPNAFQEIQQRLWIVQGC